MVTRTKRSVYPVAGKHSGSKGITLPKDWAEKFPDCKQVHIIYDDLILIFRDDQANRVDQLFEDLIQRTVKTTLTQERAPHDTTCEGPPEQH